MRILILTQYYWPESFRINALADCLQAAGGDVSVLTGQPNYPDGDVFPGYRALSVRREKRPSGVDVIRVPLVPRGRRSASRLAANYLSFVVSAAVFGTWLLRGRRFDVIFVYAPSPITQSIPAVFLGRLKGARVVTWVQDLWPESLASTGFVRSEKVLRLVDWVVRWIYRKNDLIMGQSRAFVSAIAAKAGGTPVVYFPNPGEADLSRGDDAPALRLPDGFNIVFAGNLGTVQALDTVVAAAELLRDEPEIRFVIVGSGSRSEWLEQQVKERSLSNVLIAGRFPTSAMPGIYEQASALLVSLNRSEILSQTIPAKVQTYLAAGRPIIASMDGEGAALISEANAGFASPAEDATALAANIRRLEQASPEERSRMGASAKQYFDLHFQPAVLADRLLREFRAIQTDKS